ncbi:MAG: hypothetical protein ABSG51_07660 [Terracidiphilus sp.]|jgi:hypothetical protein
MTTDAQNDDQANDDPATSDPTSPRRELLPLPGLAAISLYLLVLAGVIVFGVVSGRHYPLIFLVFAAAFIASSAGLIMLFRWAWSLALAAVLLLVVYDLWIFSTQHVGPALVQGLLNLIFFLYLVRPEVRSKLR